MCFVCSFLFWVWFPRLKILYNTELLLGVNILTAFLNRDIRNHKIVCHGLKGQSPNFHLAPVVYQLWFIVGISNDWWHELMLLSFRLRKQGKEMINNVMSRYSVLDKVLDFVSGFIVWSISIHSPHQLITWPLHVHFKLTHSCSCCFTLLLMPQGCILLSHTPSPSLPL